MAARCLSALPQPPACSSACLPELERRSRCSGRTSTLSRPRQATGGRSSSWGTMQVSRGDPLSALWPAATALLHCSLLKHCARTSPHHVCSLPGALRKRQERGARGRARRAPDGPPLLLGRRLATVCRAALRCAAVLCPFVSCLGAAAAACAARCCSPFSPASSSPPPTAPQVADALQPGGRVARRGERRQRHPALRVRPGCVVVSSVGWGPASRAQRRPRCRTARCRLLFLKLCPAAVLCLLPAVCRGGCGGQGRALLPRGLPGGSAAGAPRQGTRCRPGPGLACSAPPCPPEQGVAPHPLTSLSIPAPPLLSHRSRSAL